MDYLNYITKDVEANFKRRKEKRSHMKLALRFFSHSDVFK
jgi:hypothetical protein